ncbi:MAG: hypothetical protein RI885_551 [Actinomycetota bacterium]
MQWWTDFLDWLGSDESRGVLLDVMLPFVAILVAGIVAAAIGRGSTKRLLTLNDRENRISAVATMIGAARRASVWNTLSGPEQQHADHVASEADVRVRLLAVPGSGLAADWAAHELLSMKKNSVSFSFQAEQSLIEFRDRMVTWQAKPNRARKLFKNDLDLWAYEDSQQTNDIVSQQRAWAAAQVATETEPVSNPSKPADVVAPRPSDSFAPPIDRPSLAAPATIEPPRVQTLPDRDIQAATPSDSHTDDRAAADGDDDARREDHAEAPALIEPEVASNSARDADSVSVSATRESDQDDDDEMTEAAYSPVTANAVTKRNNPPSVGDDGRKY